MRVVGIVALILRRLWGRGLMVRKMAEVSGQADFPVAVRHWMMSSCICIHLFPIPHSPFPIFPPARCSPWPFHMAQAQV